MDNDLEEKVLLKGRVEFSKSKVVSMWFVSFFAFLYGCASISESWKYIARHGIEGNYISFTKWTVTLSFIGVIIAFFCIAFIFIYENKIVGWYLMVGSLLLKISLLIIINGSFYILYKTSGIKSYDLIFSRACGGFIVLDALLVYYFINEKILKYFEVTFINSVLVRNIGMLAILVLGSLLFRV